MGNEEKKEEFGQDPKGLLGETLRKVFSVGVGAAFLTEEALRNYLKDMRLPQELLSGLLQQANKSKEEITRRVGNEIVALVQKVDWVKEFTRFAETHKFRVHAEIEIVKKNESPKRD
ncbi:MAG: hypothetical protein N2578_09520 [Bdellovibrionaceae bacterium]|nr:hypothetical protein [Pseudobdellovibrionaceae bacterium]